jgi:hypothetical protein
MVIMLPKPEAIVHGIACDRYPLFITVLPSGLICWMRRPIP